jgi:general secretion pathway protein F/type IV pilus assembly protein PilC
MAYPAFLAVFCLFLVLGLLFFVIPSLETLFEDRQLHPLTHTVLLLSHTLRTYGIHVLSVLLFGGSGLIMLLRGQKARILLSKICLKIPIIKTLTITAALVRFFRTGSLLLRGGVPLLKAIHLARTATKNRAIETIIARGEEKIGEGKLFSEQLENQSLIPPMVPRMIAIAEETGTMATMMRSIADIHEEELEKDLSQLTAFLQPALLLLLGLVVGVVLLSILLPLTDVNSFLSG